MQRLEVWLGLVLVAGAGTFVYSARADAAADPRVEEVVVKMHQDRQNDIALAKQAQERASSPAVRELAARQERDHQAADDRLLEYAHKAGVSDDRLAAEAEALRFPATTGLPGKALDAQIAATIVAAHQADVDRARSAQLMASDPELKTIIGQTIPVLRAQLAASQIVAKSVTPPVGSEAAAAASTAVPPPDLP